MLEIYKDKETEIYFSDTPKVDVRYVLPWTSETEAKEIKLKPFLCENKITVVAVDKTNGVEYKFTIQENYTWDGASIPRMFWRMIGSKTDNCFLIPSYVHDYMCENHFVVGFDRQFSSRIFKGLLLSCGVSKFKAETMFLAVDNFQRFCGWKSINEKS